ncbi:S41 family peptidase [Longimicrobium sp.]|uniref:S41 family peptidase n=1 Tax=Longimicrobium sp. TaxID=2029185 RepID=UPI002BABFE00|nr:S41 family peptidase [Longimicrobium sp.]HSU16559.1 S41 family peptidase [Longimicrobium sp.]
MKLKRTVVAPALVAGVALVSGGWLLQRGVTGQQSVFQRAQLFDEVLHYVETRYVDEHAEGDLYQKAIEGMLGQLGDPHTVFMTADEYAQLHLQTSGEYGGLGIQLAPREGYITAVSVLPGTPAERAGIRVGDMLVEIDGKDAKGWNEDFAVKALRGAIGTPVNLTVRRVGVDQPLHFTINREEIHLHSVPYAYMAAPGVGYVDLLVFSQTSTDELRAAIERLKQQGARKLVLDLRGNPGGLLDQGVAVSDLFLRRGQSIVETRYRNPMESETYRASSDEAVDLPMVVLVDAYSASAAEIVSGALQDHDRALVIGTTSYGKGSVQSVYRLSGGNFLKLTTGKWYTPSGRSIQKPYRPGQTEADADADSASAAADTTRRRAYRTDSGRTVMGGGGIVPDLTVRDTTTLAERAFITAVSRKASVYNSVVMRYALEYERRMPNLQPSFPVTPQMRQELFTRLRAAGVEITPEQYAGAQRWVDRQLANQIAVSRFGQSAAAQRNDVDDKALQEAVRLLQASPNQAALFRAAEQAQARQRVATGQ